MWLPIIDLSCAISEMLPLVFACMIPSDLGLSLNSDVWYPTLHEIKLQPWSLSTIMLLWHSFLIIIIIISGFGIYGAAVVPDSGVGNTWQRLTLVLHEFLSNGLTPSRIIMYNINNNNNGRHHCRWSSSVVVAVSCVIDQWTANVLVNHTYNACGLIASSFTVTLR